MATVNDIQPPRLFPCDDRDRVERVERVTARASTASRPCGCDGTGDLVWQEAGYRGRRCACGLVYIDPAPPPRPRGEALEYHSDGYYALPAELRLDWVQSWCPRGRLLEVGPGRGHLLAAARRRGFTVAGVDPDPTSVRLLRDELGIEAELATIETSRLPEAAFDVVVHVDLLSHLEDPVLALRAMAARLAPGGHVIFEVGLLGGVSPLWYRAIGRVGFPEHRWLFSQGALVRMLARAGLALAGVRRYGLAPSVALLVLKRAAGLAGAGRSRGPGAVAPPASAADRLYERAMFALRYRIGRFAPPVGPQSLLIAARAQPGAASARR